MGMFILGLFVGAFLGVVAMSLACAASKDQQGRE